jgi:hypothetical protein
MTTKDLTADDILGVEDRPIEPVEVPEWGGRVYVRTMSARERDAIEAEVHSLGEERSLENARARFCARVICNADGEPLFTTKQIPELGKKSAAALDRVFAVGSRLNGFTAKDAEELSGN